MAHKMTARRVAAIETLKKEGANRNFLSKDSDVLYDHLTTLGYWWDSSAGEWKKGKAPSTSIFKDDDDLPTGIIRLRLMGHPDDMEAGIAAARRAYDVAEVSGQYPNRKGSGVRVYITAKLQEPEW